MVARAEAAKAKAARAEAAMAEFPRSNLVIMMNQRSYSITFLTAFCEG